MLAVVPLQLLALVLSNGGSTRRVALQGATAAALGALATPHAARAELGRGGALRENIGQSVKGDGVEILLTELTYKELKACPPNFFIPPRGGPWDCIEISGVATNQGKRDVSAAAVFGLVKDAEGYSCSATALDPSQKTATATLGALPRGKSDVSFVVAIQGRSPRPLTLAGFKASYRNAAIERTFETFDPCEVDSSQCGDEDQPDNAKKSVSQTGLFGAQY